MRAAVVRSFTEPLVVEDRPVPTPAGHQVLVRMEASGLCHTDIHAAQGGLAGQTESALRPRP